MLATTVSRITSPVHPLIPLTCHTSTLYWIYKDLFGKAPTRDSYEHHMLDTSGVVTSMIRLGRRISKPMMGSLMLTAGSVIIFANGGAAEHSCIASSATALSGNNQTDWFSTPGRVMDFSTHSVNDLKWSTSIMSRSNVTRGHHSYELYAVSEVSAKQVVRALFPVTEGVII